MEENWELCWNIREVSASREEQLNKMMDVNARNWYYPSQNFFYGLGLCILTPSILHLLFSLTTKAS